MIEELKEKVKLLSTEELLIKLKGIKDRTDLDQNFALNKALTKWAEVIYLELHKRGIPL